MINLESLRPYALRLSQSPRDENARSNLVVRLQLCSDLDTLSELAMQFPFDAAVAVPVWQRIAAVANDDAAIQVKAAGVMYGLGLDVEARRFVDAALALDSRYLLAWELKAALTADPGERRNIYEHILTLDAGNRTAIDNLIMMGRPRE